MIFTALGLLLVAAGLLLAGIAKSSVALLTASLLLTIGAGVVLALVLPAARKLSEATGGGAQLASTPQGQPVVLYVQQAPTASTTEPQATIDLTRAAASDAHANGTSPFIGYDLLTAKQVTELINSGSLTEEQLAALRDYEESHAARRTVLAKLS
jgi:hypothetical protein